MTANTFQSFNVMADTAILRLLPIVGLLTLVVFIASSVRL